MKLRIAMLLLCAGAFYTFVAKSPPMHKEEGNQQHVDMETSEVRLHGNREHSNKINLVYLNENLLLARVFSFYWRKCFPLVRHRYQIQKCFPLVRKPIQTSVINEHEI
jgi:hypothetical protein